MIANRPPCTHCHNSTGWYGGLCNDCREIELRKVQHRRGWEGDRHRDGRTPAEEVPGIIDNATRAREDRGPVEIVE